jgi:hypothetical protein
MEEKPCEDTNKTDKIKNSMAFPSLNYSKLFEVLYFFSLFPD